MGVSNQEIVIAPCLICGNDIKVADGVILQGSTAMHLECYDKTRIIK